MLVFTSQCCSPKQLLTHLTTHEQNDDNFSIENPPTSLSKLSFSSPTDVRHPVGCPCCSWAGILCCQNEKKDSFPQHSPHALTHSVHSLLHRSKAFQGILTIEQPHHHLDSLLRSLRSLGGVTAREQQFGNHQQPTPGSTTVGMPLHRGY